MSVAPRVRSTRAPAWIGRAGVRAALLIVVLASPATALGATRYVSPSGVDGGACNIATAPCRSFGHAYRQAAPGDVVEVAGGQYGSQSIPHVSGRGGPAVTFHPAPGAQPTLGGLNIAGGFVTVRDMWTGEVAIDAGDGGATPVDNVSLINGGGPQMWIQTARNLLVRGGSYGGNQDEPTIQTGGNPASSNLTFDGVDFHDAVATNSTVHMECIWAGGVQGFTVRNSIFRNCAYFDIFFTTLNGPDPKDVLLENNVFEVTKQSNGQNAPYAVNVANWLEKAENFTFRNNTFGGDVAIQPNTIVNMKLVGNVGAIASCKGGVSYSYNVFTAAKCADTDKRIGGALSQFVNPGGHDWRLKAGAAAIDAGNPNDFPAADRAGLLRNGPPDAGAHEYNGISPGGPGGLPGLRLPVAAKGILKVRLSRHVICKRVTRRCRGVARLRVVLGSKLRLRVALKRQRGGRSGKAKHWSTAKRLRRSGKRGANVFRIGAHGLRRGRYRVVVSTKLPSAASRQSRARALKVR